MNDKTYELAKKARELLVAQYNELDIEPQAARLMAQGHQPGGVHYAAVKALITALAQPTGYATVQLAPLMEMLEEGWDAMDSEGDADFFDPEALAPAWAAMVAWCVRNPGAAP